MNKQAKPESLAFFNNWAEQSLLALDMAKEQSQLIVGAFCTYAPLEIIRAAGAVPVSLCGKRQEPISEAERILPANLCPLIKSSFGYAVTETCPFYNASDILIGETTCDGKKKMFEILKKLKPFYLLHLPYSQTDPAALALWKDQVWSMKLFMEKQTGKNITQQDLQHQILKYNEQRRLLKSIAWLMADHPVPVKGMDLLPVFESSSFVVDMARYIQSLENLFKDLSELKKSGFSACPENAPRILLTGCPIGKGSEKVLRLIEECGGVVVCMENCTGIKSFDLLVEEQGDPYHNLALRYLRTPCSCMTPNQGRFDLVRQLAQEFKVNGIIDQTWQFCHTYNVESNSIQDMAANTLNLPFMHIDTDYSDNDTEQLRTRIEAFLEMIS
ncbi:double-cubane-cluster-containing anaerobic reductase [Desulfonatronovibrio hydrogenovorans]|uniref:double-cubane-cluster-containing anaerobic reductase n=1 Tax=Desulfonatronovibrio hydrogenovorans TaxID=53245 RepID=UPI0005539A41|nr:double-cubane-cluster-containing anaerobic reductase [Desulfonatronovibrio hydrogenovorans]